MFQQNQKANVNTSKNTRQMKISIEGIEYEIDLYDDILLHSPDHTLIIKEGWLILLNISDFSRDFAMFKLDRYIHEHINEAIRVTE